MFTFCQQSAEFDLPDSVHMLLSTRGILPWKDRTTPDSVSLISSGNCGSKLSDKSGRGIKQRMKQLLCQVADGSARRGRLTASLRRLAARSSVSGVAVPFALRLESISNQSLARSQSHHIDLGEL